MRLPRSIWLPATLGAGSWAAALIGGGIGVLAARYAGAIAIAGGFWIMDVTAFPRGLSMAFGLTSEQARLAEQMYYSREMRVPRYRLGFWVSLLGSVTCALSTSEVLTGTILILWGW